MDYVVVKMPRWTFEKFPDSDETLTTQMKSVGEAMAIGRTFKEALQKCIRSMEIQRFGLGLDHNDAWLASRENAQSTKNETVTSELTNDGKTLGGSTATEAPPDTEEEHAKSWPITDEVLYDKLSRPCQGRIYYIRYAMKMDWTIEKIHELTGIDPWFLDNIQQLVEAEEMIHRIGADTEKIISHKDGKILSSAKQLGYSDVQIAKASQKSIDEIGQFTRNHRMIPSYKLVDTCGAEFEARTPYYYSTYESGLKSLDTSIASVAEDEIRISDKPKIVVLGGGPNRIGQGIEFDYCCCHASYAVKKAGYESIMINSNPETVSTDFDTSDMLFFEPLTEEDVLHVIERLNGKPLDLLELNNSANSRGRKPAAQITSALPRSPKPGAIPTPAWACLSSEPSRRLPTRRDLISPAAQVEPLGLVMGVIVQFGGQTPLNLAQGLKNAGVPIIGTQPEMIHAAEDRDQFQQVLRELSLLQPPNGIARGPDDARSVAQKIGYPILVRPSYVLGGRGMKICNNESDLEAYLHEAFDASDRAAQSDDNPILIDKFLADAIEVDVDAVADYGRYEDEFDDTSPSPTCMVMGIMEHIEEAGIHSGDSTCVLPPFSLGPMVIEELFRSTKRLAKRLQVCGAMNVQYAILNRTVYVLEVNPRASRTLPFVAKATGVPWAEVATRVMLGEPLEVVLESHGIAQTPKPGHISIKAPVFPFDRFSGSDVILGPEMHSTGEVMAIDSNFGRAFAKAQIATGLSLPTTGNVLVSVNDPDKPRIVSIARELFDMGFSLYSTVGTRYVLVEAGIPATLVSKSSDAMDAPFLMDLILDGTLHLLINTPIRTGPASEEGRWRAAATIRKIPLITTLAGARSAVAGIRALRKNEDGKEPLPLNVKPLQSYFA